MKNFVSLRCTALAFSAALITQVTPADASVSFLAVAAGDATRNEVTVWTRAKDEVIRRPTAINVQISRDPTFSHGESRLFIFDGDTEYETSYSIGSPAVIARGTFRTRQ